MNESKLHNVGAFRLLPAPPGTCQQCAVEHLTVEPHNQQSLFYQYWFYSQNGRWPTWADAIAHCSEPMQELWKDRLQELGAWSEPSPEQFAGSEDISIQSADKLTNETWVFVEFNSRRANRGVGAARMLYGDDKFWCTRKELQLNLRDFGPVPAIHAALEAYRVWNKS